MQIAGEHPRFFALFIYIYVFMRADLCKYARIVFMAAAAAAAESQATSPISTSSRMIRFQEA